MKTKILLNQWLQQCSQIELSEASGINRVTVNRHLKGKANINGDHLAGYIKAAPSKKAAVDFTVAWLSDTLPHDIANHILTKGGKIDATKLPNLRPETEVAIQWLCAELNTDPELESGFLRFVHWVGGSR